jgi:hypothetical protein
MYGLGHSCLYKSWCWWSELVLYISHLASGTKTLIYVVSGITNQDQVAKVTSVQNTLIHQFHKAFMCIKTYISILIIRDQKHLKACRM